MRTTVRLLTAALTLAAVVPAPAHAANGVWTPTLAATSAFDNLSAFKDGTAYATVGTVTNNTADLLGLGPGGGSSTGFFKSTDFGRTWLPMPPPPAPFSGTSNLYLRFATSRIGYASFDSATDLPPDPSGKLNPILCRKLSGTFRTTDGGVTWTPLCEPHLPNGKAFGPAASPLAVGPDGKTVVLTGAAGTYKTEDDCEIANGAMAFSTDAGTTWRITKLPAGYDPAWSVRAYDNRTALVVAYRMKYAADCSGAGDENAVFLTTDAGRTYRKVFSCAKQPICSSVAFVTRTRFLVGTTDGSTYFTNDAGRTWHHGQWLGDVANSRAVSASGNPNLANIYWVQAFGFADAQHGYASTRGAGTWRTDDGGRTWSQERSHECVYYPYGVGENASSTAETSITGGPGVFSARQATPTPAGPCHPATQSAPLPVVPPGGVAVSLPGLTIRVDGTIGR